MRSVCVFCGSSPGSRSAYVEAARSVGTLLADRKITLVYGGGHVGLMGAVADAAMAAGGEVIGVIPEALVRKEIGHTGLRDLRVVGSMHERKAQMAELAEGFIALPGGCGTFEEFFEIVTWAQLGIHRKPIGILNVEGYYAPLLAMLDKAVEERFIRPEHRALVLEATDASTLLDTMTDYHAPIVEKWIDRSQT